ncbi:MAG: EAL domain-containing protein, partial [Comamonas sp.]
TYTPVLDAQGKVRQILKIATDITARLQREQAQTEHLQRLSMVADASGTAVVISDSDARIVYINNGFSRMFGWALDEVQGRAPIALLAPHVNEEFASSYHSALRRGESVEREEIVVSKDGRRYWAKAISNPISAANSQAVTYTVTTLTDITRAKMHEVLQHRVLEAMVKESPLCEVLQLICREVERISPEITASILSVSDEGVLEPLVGPGLPSDYSGGSDWCAATVRADATAPDWQAHAPRIAPLGFVACWSTPIHNSLGRVVGIFAFYFKSPRIHAAQLFHQLMVDACVHLCSLALEREHARQRIRQLAFYDGLTGLPNRSLLQAKADQAIATAARNSDQLAVLFIDLDRFKQVNDSLGHPAGDELLRQIAAKLQQTLRGSDIAGRLSGDEFVVVLSQCHADQVTDLVERLLVDLSTPVTIAGLALSASASVGIAMFPDDGRDMETLLHRADMAMYQAKSSGRGCFSFFSSEMNQLAQERLALETALRHAIHSKQLHLHYQPQVDMTTGQLTGVEALARWNHPELGEISPARFIPLAEECGLVADLGHWALREACRQLSAWRAQGLAVPAVSVNLSTSSFHNLDLPRMIADMLEVNALQPQDLTLELTESVLLDTNPSTMKTIADVHAKGIRLSMDDFGTGYSSLSYLRRLPVSELKLDRSFVADLENDEAAQALSAAILGIGKSLHLTVVAEGIETPAQNQLLREQGYPVAQGFLFARPLSPADLGLWLRQRNADSAPTPSR